MATSLARAACSGAACAVGRQQQQEVSDQGRSSGEGTSCCSAWSCDRFRRSGLVEGAKLGVERVHFGARLWQRYESGAARTRVSQLRYREGRSRDPVCLMRGVNGAFWEGADSESPANVHFTSEVESSEKEGSVLLSLIREIEPLDISLISKDASPDSTSAMKRTISGMLGLLPSDQFQVTIETPPDHLARLLVSSMMTGYTLRNAEYRLCLQRNLDQLDEDIVSDPDNQQMFEIQDKNESQRVDDISPTEEHLVASDAETVHQTLFPEVLEGVSSEAASYIQELQAKLSAASKISNLVGKELELEECKNALSAMELVRQEKNDLLDYLRSLKPEKVAELSQPSTEVHDVVQQVVAGLLGSMVSKVSPQVPPFGTNTLTSSWEETEEPDVIGNIPLQFQSTVTLTSSRDYLARLLFWCTLLGYHIRGLEYRLELSRTLSLSGLEVEDDQHNSCFEVEEDRHNSGLEMEDDRHNSGLEVEEDIQ